ncbi:MAG: FlgD immunoglobulin-like domain containing protein [Candidatus Kapaibacterium sp.]
MRRFLKALLLLVMSAVVGQSAMAQVKPIAQVAGRLGQTEYRVFTKDSLYQIAGDYHVSGLLIIEPGTTVEFLPDGRLIDSVGGKIIADGELDAIWNRNTGAVSGFPNRYCDLDYIRANVNISGRPEFTAQGGPNGSPNWVNYASYLLFYKANNLQRCATDPNLRLRQYERDVRREPIIFRGRPVNQNSEEWGHIVILPGADTAVFRNVQFVNFRKDTGVVRNQQFYSPQAIQGYDNQQIVSADILNKKMRSLTSGGGGAITTFSSKTWILNSRFDSNMARYHGGALQLLQSPWDQYVEDPGARSFFPRDPSLGAAHDQNTYPAGDLNVYLDNVDVYGSFITTPFGTIPTMRVTVPNSGPVQYRMLYDDGRQAANLGRIRRVYFRDNRAMVISAIRDVNGYRDDPTNPPPDITDGFIGGIAKNEAYGGAIYISGRRYDTIYFGNGLALSLMTGGIVSDPLDTLVFERNYAANFQKDSTGGAKGGAIYVNDSTALDFGLSRFNDNFTATPNVPMTDWYRRSHMSQGGGIYMAKASPYLRIRDNVSFTNNRSGQGGAIYVEAIVNPFGQNIAIYDPFLSPEILGRDSIYFLNNKAEYDGGAIYTMRNMVVQGRFITTFDSVSGALIDRRVLFDSNAAGLAGGAIVIDNQTHHSITLESNARVLNTLFSYNAAGDSNRVDDTRLIKYYDPLASPANPTNPYSVATLADRYQLPVSLRSEILGGGAIYSRYGNTNLFRAVEFLSNWTIDGNGGAISMVTPVEANRYFLADGDEAYAYSPSYPGGSVLPFNDGPEPADMRYMTRFLKNKAVKGSAPFRQHPRDTTTIVLNTLDDPYRNGTGLGGAIYLNDRLQPVGGAPGFPREDSVILHRVRVQGDTAYSGAAVYSDNYNMKVVFSRSLIANNVAVSNEGRNVDTFANWQTTPAASRTAGAILYGEIQGPMPLTDYHTGANSIYDNDARYLVRIADAPPGTFGLGASGADTLRGNFWGEVQAPVTTILPTGTQQETFFVQGDSCWLPLKNGGAAVNEQGPFESKHVYNYRPVPYGMIPDTLLLEGRIYDIYDKGLDIRAVDYSGPRMAPIEDFSVGIPPVLRQYPAGSVYEGKVVRRLTRDPFKAEVDTTYAKLMREFVGDHPIGYPLFLESRADYLGDLNTDNNDSCSLNHTVMLVINAETGEFIRSNLKQYQEGDPRFWSRVEFVPDSINRDVLGRRATEQRAAFSIGELYRLTPAYYLEQGATLEEARFLAARYEDSIALDGRRYGGAPNILGGPTFSYVNRPTAPTFVDVYAGERYHALPVKTGDRVWVISRTMLWNTDSSRTWVENISRFTGMEFRIDIDNSVLAPFLRGQIDSLQAKTPSELRNTRFLWEDREYESDPTGRVESPILDVTANEINGFYDPRSLFFPDRYTGLRYEWSPLIETPGFTPSPSTNPAAIRLASWLKADTIYPANVHPDAIARDTAHKWGFLRFWGNPHNPDVVPGGELLEVRVSNYPPDQRTIDSLKGLVGADTVACYIFLYPPYFNCQVYDPANARYLQQDTVNISSASTATYRLRIFVQDSIPVELNSVPGCFDLGRNLVIAQWTDKLRFNYDVNTDDEVEDRNAEAEFWDFRYGRTTYGFVFTQGNTGTTDDVSEVRPVWLGDQYLRDVNQVLDNGATVLQTGNMVVRIDSTETHGLLRNPAQVNNTFNLDSVFTMIVNDGHTGNNKFDFRVLVNAQPRLLPNASGQFVLPNAKEDFDYNRTLLDLSRAIRSEDLNRGQRRLYSLVYRDDALNAAEIQDGAVVKDTTATSTATIAKIRKDTCYLEAGILDAPKTTPSWIKINPVSGILYGTPGLNDAPRTDSVTVIVTDEYGLSDVRSYRIVVDSTQHPPDLRGLPPIRCAIVGRAYKDSLCVSDRDFGRLAAAETVTLTATARIPGNEVPLTVVPASITGPHNPDTCIPLSIETSAIPTAFAGQKMTVVVIAEDAAGNKDTLSYEVSVSDAIDFAMTVRVENTNVADGDSRQYLTFGLAQNATTGEDAGSLGELDEIYCEYELPPLPPTDVFDARWTVPNNNGIQRNFYPTNPSSGQIRSAWKAFIQPGNLAGGSPFYPVKICWSISEAQTSDSILTIADLRSDEIGTNRGAFRVSMSNPTGHNVYAVNGIRVEINGDSACVVILEPGIIEGFKIFYGSDSTSSVDNPVAGSEAGFQLAANVPNPVTSTTEIAYTVPSRSDVRLDIFDVNGKLVKTLINGSVPTGRHTAVWNGTDEQGRKAASGTYTYRLSSGTTVIGKTMIVTR